MYPDPHAALRERVIRTVLEGPGHAPSDLRLAAFAGRDLPADLATLVEKEQAHAYKVNDDDVGHAKAAHGDDVTFEVIVSAALGAASQRLAAGHKALEEA
jgi:hypothetical protein